MKIHLIKKHATKEEIRDMLKALKSYIKLAVDIKREILAGGGILHADCEAILLQDGSKQQDVWGADWLPEAKQLTFEALINIRPRQNNFSMRIQDEVIREKIEEITRGLLE
jgi:copper homeostasis protein CutC